MALAQMNRLPEAEHRPWYQSVWLWWLLLTGGFGFVYITLW